jgi:hypothetical protein
VNFAHFLRRTRRRAAAPLSTTIWSSGDEWFVAGEAAKVAGGCNAAAKHRKEFVMFTLNSSKRPVSRVAASLKYGLILVLLGLIVIATERPMLLSPAGAVTVADDAAYVADQARAKAASAAAVAPAAAAPSIDDVTYYPSKFPAPSGPVEVLPPQF